MAPTGNNDRRLTQPRVIVMTRRQARDFAASENMKPTTRGTTRYYNRRTGGQVFFT